jgi:hypothetical protein
MIGVAYAARMASSFPFDFRVRAATGDLGRAIASVWFAKGTIPYRREKVAATGSTVAVLVLGDPIVETAGTPRAEPFRAETGFLIGPHDRPVTNEPTGETFAIGIVPRPRSFATSSRPPAGRSPTSPQPSPRTVSAATRASSSS